MGSTESYEIELSWHRFLAGLEARPAMWPCRVMLVKVEELPPLPSPCWVSRGGQVFIQNVYGHVVALAQGRYEITEWSEERRSLDDEEDTEVSIPIVKGSGHGSR